MQDLVVRRWWICNRRCSCSLEGKHRSPWDWCCCGHVLAAGGRGGYRSWDGFDHLAVTDFGWTMRDQGGAYERMGEEVDAWLVSVSGHVHW